MSHDINNSQFQSFFKNFPEAILPKVAEKTINALKKNVDNISTSFENKDHIRLGEYTHSLKGSFLNLGDEIGADIAVKIYFPRGVDPKITSEELEELDPKMLQDLFSRVDIVISKIESDILKH